MMPHLLYNARLVCPERGIQEQGWLVTDNGLIEATSFDHDSFDDSITDRIDCAGQIVGPGFVDMRVQSGYPGSEHLETLESLLKAAASQGITSLAVLPNTEPVIDNAAIIDSLMLRAGGYGLSQLYCYGAMSRGLEGEQMAELGMMSKAGAVGFANADISIPDAQTMRRIMTYAKMFNRPVIHHCAEASLTADTDMNEGETATRLGLIGQPAAAETLILQRDIALAEMTGAHYHAAHISAAASVSVIRDAKARGVNITADTAPPYFMLNEISVSGFDSSMKLTPPLRSEDDRLAIRDGLADGTIDAIASDHVPVDADQKTQPFSLASAGASALETLVPLSLTLVRSSHLTWQQFFQRLSAAPAHILGLQAGSVRAGMPADLVQINPDTAHIINPQHFVSLSRITPFAGLPCEGRVTGCWIGGEAKLSSGADKTGPA